MSSYLSIWIAFDYEGANMGFNDNFMDHVFVVLTFGVACSYPRRNYITSFITLIYDRPVNLAVDVYSYTY